MQAWMGDPRGTVNRGPHHICILTKAHTFSSVSMDAKVFCLQVQCCITKLRWWSASRTKWQQQGHLPGPVFNLHDCRLAMLGKVHRLAVQLGKPLANVTGSALHM